MGEEGIRAKEKEADREADVWAAKEKSGDGVARRMGCGLRGRARARAREGEGYLELAARTLATNARKGARESRGACQARALTANGSPL